MGPAKAAPMVLANREAADLTIVAQVEVKKVTEEATRRALTAVPAVQVAAAIRLIGRIKTVLPDGVAATARRAADRDLPRHSG